MVSITNERDKQEYLAKLKKEIVPAIVDEDEIVSEVISLDVQYSKVSVSLGNELTPCDTKESPVVNWLADKDAYYTLLMTDPDAPSRDNPILGEVEHWLIVDIPSNNVQEGHLLTEYIGPGPPQGSGLHRYIFILFKQPDGKICFSESYKPTSERESRRKFSTRKFIQKYNLGKVIASNYFLASWDESVGMKKISLK